MTREVLKGHRGAAVLLPLPLAILYPGRVRLPCKVYYPPSFQNGDSTLQPYISIHDDKSPSVMRKDGHLNPPLQFFRGMVLGHPHANCTNLPAFQSNHTDLSWLELQNLTNKENSETASSKTYFLLAFRHRTETMFLYELIVSVV